MDRLDMQRPDMQRLDMDRPDMQRLDMDRPDMRRLDMDRPDMRRLDMLDRRDMRRCQELKNRLQHRDISRQRTTEACTCQHAADIRANIRSSNELAERSAMSLALVLPGPPRSLMQTEISRFRANSAELAGFRAAFVSADGAVECDGPFRRRCLRP